jgi:hypothetical protein
MNNFKYNAPQVWLDFLVVSVLSISAVAIALLMFDVFNPRVVVFAGMAIAVPAFYLIRDRIGGIADIDGANIASIAAIVFIALMFRAEPFPWINGGQDQGVYVNMSSYYQRGEGVFIEDNVLPALSGNELKNVYLDNRSETILFHPGVYYGGKSDYVFQFYHLHSLWMAMSAEFFGDDARVYSLTFFSLLSIVFIGLLAFELSGSRLAAFGVGLLLAVNPLHVFFSKWPVTEVVALAYSSIGFYYLVRAHKLSNIPDASRFSLVIAGIALSLLFFVRISGFLYLPILIAIFMIGSWQYKTHADRFGRDLVFFSLTCIALYVASVFYGLYYSPGYSADIYRLTFGKALNGQWQLVMVIAFVAMTALMFTWARLLNNRKLAARVAELATPKILIIAIFLLAVVVGAFSLFKVYKLGYSNSYDGHRWLDMRWGLSGSGIGAVIRSSVINWFIYSSPVLVILGGIAILRKRHDLRLVLVCLVALVPLAVFAMANPIIPYQYYYSRYLLSESVPYAMVACVVALFAGGSGRWRILGVTAVALSIPLFGYYTLKQYGAEEGVRPISVLRKISDHVDEADVLLIEPAGWQIPRELVETPLRFYFDIRTFVLPGDARDAHRKEIARSFRNVWLLSPVVIDDERFTLVERLLHSDKVVERSGNIPTRIVDDFWHQELFLYSMKKIGFPGANKEDLEIDLGRYAVSRNSSEIQAILGGGWYAIETSHVWATEKASINLEKSMFAGDELPKSIALEISTFGATTVRPVSLDVLAGEQRLEFKFTDAERRIIVIPIKSPCNPGQCAVDFTVKNATSPKLLGASADERVLGFALHAITFE